MSRQAQFFPPMPELGHTEAYYKEMVRQAEQNHSVHAREAAKVGQYVTLGINEDSNPAEKMKFFRHALRKHCRPPQIADDMVEGFYERLADFVRAQAGQEALRMASVEDDRFAMRERNGENRIKLVLEARRYFERLLGTTTDERPDLFLEEDWEQLRLIRNQWDDASIPPDAGMESAAG